MNVFNGIIPHKYVNASDNPSQYEADQCGRQAVTALWLFQHPDLAAWVCSPDSMLDIWRFEIDGVDANKDCSEIYLSWACSSTGGRTVGPDFEVFVQVKDLIKLGFEFPQAKPLAQPPPMPTPPKLVAHNMPGIKELVRRANMDDDHATIFWLGDNEATADGCIIVVRGNEAARLAAHHLTTAKLYVPHLVCPNEPTLYCNEPNKNSSSMDASSDVKANPCVKCGNLPVKMLVDETGDCRAFAMLECPHCGGATTKIEWSPEFSSPAIALKEATDLWNKFGTQP